MSEKYKVFIPCADIGVHLGDLVKYTNRALVKIGKKPVLSYIFETYPKDTEFIIAVGHFADQIKDFIHLAYPKHKVTFAQVDKYQGPGSNLIYSMLCAKNHLNQPFIYHASDTITNKYQPSLNRNWVGGFRGEGSSNYASFNTLNGRVSQFYDKGMINPHYLHIGLIGIKDYQDFWKLAQALYSKNPDDNELNDTLVISRMIMDGHIFEARQLHTWHDTGNIESLKKAREEIEDTFHILDKFEESIFLFDKYVIKFFHDEKMVADRVKRAKILEGLVPKIKSFGKNFYKYEHIKGNLYADVANPQNFADFLLWAKTNLWRKTKEVPDEEFKKICYKFYYTKSVERIEKFLSTRSIKDEANIINEIKVPSIKEIFKKIDFNWLCNSEQSNYHGDFILDNMLKTKNGYCLLDWRQNFGGLYKAGDMYYDLSKLNHNLTVNHGIVNEGLFTIEIKKDIVNCDILRKHNLVLCQDVLANFLKEENYDIRKVKVLTALIWLNMSPLHHHPLDLFLYYFGKLNLWKAIQ